ncbi:MAG: DUF2330 domain-containing protein [Deltaproteobacteria bacterium]|nr:DUF2330 domain-containing protein [Deltaproteobacteria bacterium]
MPTYLFALTATCALLVPDAALACGGFFCSSGPVDQGGEDILFEVDPDGNTSVVVEVKYNGDPGAFTWIVPVPEVPTVDVVPALTLAILKQQTEVQVYPPPVSYENCYDDYVTSTPSVGCSNRQYAATPGNSRQRLYCRIRTKSRSKRRRHRASSCWPLRQYCNRLLR